MALPVEKETYFHSNADLRLLSPSFMLLTLSFVQARSQISGTAGYLLSRHTHTLRHVSMARPTVSRLLCNLLLF